MNRLITHRTPCFESSSGLSLALLVMVCAATSSMAAAKRWSGLGGNSDWRTSSNWSPASVPGTTDDVLFDNSLSSIPTSMVVNGGALDLQTLTFSAGFNPSSTTLVGGGGSQASSLTIGGVGTHSNPLVQVNSTAGTITFDRRNGGTADLGITLGTTGSIDVNSGATLIINCDISGSAGFTKTGAGRLRLRGTNTYAGATIVNEGILALEAAGASACSISNSPVITVRTDGTLDVSGISFALQGSQALDGGGVVNGNVSVLPGGTILAGPVGSAGTLTFTGNLALSGATLVLDLANVTTEGAGTNDEVLVSGNLTLSGNNTILLNYLYGSLPAGTFKVLRFSGTKTGHFTLGASYPNVTLDETSTPGYVTLVVGPGGSTIPTLTWRGDGVNNLWNKSTPNWSNNSSAVLYFDPANVTIDDSGSATPAINLTTVVSPGLVLVATTNHYTISGVGNIGGTPWVLNSFIVSGNGTLTLNTTNDFAGGMNILAGRLKVGNPFAIPSGPAKGDVLATGTLDLNGNNITINGLYGAGTVDNSAGAGTYVLTMGVGEAGGLFSGVIKNTSGSLAINKVGGGTFTLSGLNTYSGATTVSSGTLLIQGSVAGGAVTVKPSATLGGNGLIRGPVTVQSGGTLSPGASIGTLIISNSLTLLGGVVMAIDKTNGTIVNDRVRGITTLGCGGLLTVIATGDPLSANDMVDLFDATTFTGSFAQLDLAALSPGLIWDTSRLAVDGTIRVVPDVSIATAPQDQTVECGGSASLSVAANGSAPLNYQWFFGNTPLPPPTGPILTLNPASFAQAGAYKVVVSNAGGSVTSLVAHLTVHDTTPPVVSLNGANPLTIKRNTTFTEPGATAADSCDGSLSVNASGTVDTSTVGPYTRTYTATDSHGNVGTTTRTVNVVPGQVTIAGKINYNGHTNTVPGTLVTLSGDASQTATIGSDGTFSFVVSSGGNYVITPTKSSDTPVSQGVTAADVTLIRRHILALAPLDTDYKVIAGDVDGSASLSAADVSLIRHLILGLTNSFPPGLWEFVPSNFIFTNSAIPWPYPTNRTYANLSVDANAQDFVAMKLGDVNGSWTNPPAGGPAGPLGPSPVTLVAPDQTASSGETLLVPVLVTNFQGVTSLQFSFTWDPAVLQFLSLTNANPLAGANFNTNMTAGGALAFEWDSDVQGSNLIDGTTLFSLQFLVIGTNGTVSAISLGDSPTIREVALGLVPTVPDWRSGLVTVAKGVNPRIVSIEPQLGGVYRLVFSGTVGKTYSIQYTDDLGSHNWIGLGTRVANQNGAFEFLDTPPVGANPRFYRATFP